MFYRYRDMFNRFIYDFSLRKTLNLPRIQLDNDSNTILLSILQKKDMIMYLLAVQSFTRYVKVSKVFVMNDDSLDTNDIHILKRTIPEITILNKTSYRSSFCPENGTWERLLAISELIDNYYVVQLDADTLSIAPIPEVQNCILSQTAFTLGTCRNQTFESMESRAEIGKSMLKKGHSHLQIHAEANLDKIDEYQNLKYVRGCSGFAGFPRRSFSKNFIENISSKMFSILEEKWTEWGSEQVMSNIVIANIEKNNVLSYPEYCAVNQIDHKTCFIHFIGSYRFKNGVYIKKSKDVLNELIH